VHPLSYQDSPSPPTPRAFSEKVKACQSTVDYWKDYGARFREAKANQSLSLYIYKNEMKLMLGSYRPALEELDVLRKRQKIII
jgi:hypothetical protein